MNQIKRKNLLKLFLAIFVFSVVAVFSLGMPQIVHAANDSCGVTDLFCSAFKWLLIGVFNFVSLIFIAGSVLFSWVLNPANLTGTIDSPSIYAGWTLVRDFLNIAFILMLLFIAFCIIFQVEKYGNKKLILWLIIMALLVNFSFPISRFIIDVANTLMYTMINSLSSFKGVSGDNGYSVFAKITDFTGLKAIIAPNTDNSFGYIIAAIVFIFILGITFFAIAILLAIRIVALAILVDFSPVAFVGSLIGKGGQWWSYLFKYAFFGPIMIFMIHLAVLMTQKINQEDLRKFIQSASANSDQDANLIGTIAAFAIPIVILWMGMLVAQQMSIAGAGAITKAAGNFAKFGKGSLSRSLGGAFLKAVDRNTLAKWKISPRQIIRGWKETTARAEKDKLAVGTGAWNDRINWALSLGKEETHYKEFAIESQIAEKKKELDLMAHGSDDVLAVLEKAKKHGGLTSQYMAVAAMRKLAEPNDFNDYMDYKKIDTNSFGENGTRENIYKDLLATGMDKDEANRQLYQLGEIGYSKGNLGLYGMAKMVNGKYVKNDDAGQLKAALGKMKNVDAQQLMKMVHPDSFYIQSAPVIDKTTGKVIKEKEVKGLTLLGKAFFQTMLSPQLTKQLHRSRPDFLETTHKATRYIEKTIEHTTAEQAKNIKDFIAEKDAMVMQKGKKESSETSAKKEASPRFGSGLGTRDIDPADLK